MTRHLLKLVWNRKRTNGLMILEIFFSFLVVFVVATLGIYFWDNYRQSLGYSWQNVWKVSVDMKAGNQDDDATVAARLKVMERLLRELEALEPVQSAAAAMVSPYEQGGWTMGTTIDGKDVEAEGNGVTTKFAEVLGLEVVAGRWFREEDAALSWDPIVIDQDLARTVWGDEDPVGRQFGDPDPKETPKRVIGVVREFRKGGELAARTNFMFQYMPLDAPSWFQPQSILLRIQPGTSAAFEEKLSALLQGVAPEWSFRIKPLAEERQSTFRTFLAPLIAGGIVAFFLLLMVALGLLGVLWQNLLQRTRELGLRRAAGASRSAVHRQVLYEQVILTSFGVLLGAVVVIQIPVLDLIGFIRPQVFAAGFLFAMVAMYLLSALCAFYPSTLASRVQPAEALRYE
ncbi:MAG: putative transport system permease protein [Acidobacteriota bacterium]|jgi:putative ABC transport system permease protein|nr:putative transport system permease protein [Acidobacteriota bacterium]